MSLYVVGLKLDNDENIKTQCQNVAINYDKSSLSQRNITLFGHLICD